MAGDISRDLVDTTSVTIVKQDDTKFINDFEVLKDLGKGSYGKVPARGRRRPQR